MTEVTDEELRRGVVGIVGDVCGYEALMAQGQTCRFCAEPVRLVGRALTIDGRSGEVLEEFSSAQRPWGQLVKACGTRRSSRCPSCAALYRGDARQLITRGLLDEPGSVTERPAAFATLTAPSFGAVHRVAEGNLVCQSDKGRCPHGRLRWCRRAHVAEDRALGEALCIECYDFQTAVLFNASASELWRRTRIATLRQLGKLIGIPVREVERDVTLSYLKVCEFQRRGVVHLHVVLRLDAEDGALAPGMSAEVLCAALRLAAASVRVPAPGASAPLRFGTQVDCQPLDPDTPEAARRIVGYLAKYATKGSDDAGGLDRPLRSLQELASRKLSPQLHQMAATAWKLGGREDLESLGLRRWAHTLGLRGHFLTKSRHFSTTFGALRQVRRDHERAAYLGARGIEVEAGDLVVEGDWEYLGRGWSSLAEAHLVASEARHVAAARRLAYEERFLPGPGLP